jgi:phosphoribosyl 1,2-cyclic phosphodiesterase
VAKIINPKENFIKFLGTAGARFVMIEQLRASGGIWISYKGTNVLVDPGPGSIVRCSASKPKLNPAKLDGIILTHKHLDHANDINVMIEAMTEGGFKKRGVVFCPNDALNEDSIILKYLRNFPARIEILKERHNYRVGSLSFATSMRHLHTAETYGVKFKFGRATFAILTDTRYFKELASFYKVGLLVIAVVFLKPRPGIDHLCLADAEEIIKVARPKKVILTHFGISMLKAKPHLQARLLSKRTGIEVVAAFDGMTLDL